MGIIIRTKHTQPFIPQPDDSMIICRCEEITKGEIRKAVYDGMRTINEVKRYLRAGMGLCQGQTCQRLVLGIIASESQISAGELGHITGRMPVRPATMDYIGKSTEHSEGVERYESK
ncbi:MAG: (2Fe-2S)-binding protein [Clostridiales Family XIII bacterium]|jgi:NAD(P)H-nitrite reductase large subunit|nr:(2Fe-2S)-binding protein [Clostridiales Family XIII bacterium]